MKGRVFCTSTGFNPDNPVNDPTLDISPVRKAMQSETYGELLGDAFFALQIASMKAEEAEANGEPITSTTNATMCQWVIELAVKLGVAVQPATEEGASVIASTMG